MASLFSCCGWQTHLSGLPSNATKPMLGIHRPGNPRMPKLLQVQSLNASSAIEDRHEGQLQGYWQHVQLCNSGREKQGEFLPFILDETTVGYIHPRFVKHLKRFPDVFSVSVEGDGMVGTNDGWVTLHTSLQSSEERTNVVESVLHTLEQEGIIPGWRNEHFPVVSTFGGQTHFNLERAAVPFFGTKAYGVHMNGYVQIDGEKHLWVAKRSATKQTYPGMLDHLVAGGQNVDSAGEIVDAWFLLHVCPNGEGISCKENILKECDEEAAIPASLASKAVAVGAVSYQLFHGETCKRDVLFCYDLELPIDFQPYNKDGEVEYFELLPVSEVAKIIHTSRQYKPNCALVVIDFLFRHGYIHPDQPGYLHLLQSLRSGECQ